MRIVTTNTNTFYKNDLLSCKTIIDIPSALQIFGDPKSYEKISALVIKLNNRWNRLYPINEEEFEEARAQGKELQLLDEWDHLEQTEVIRKGNYVDPKSKTRFDSFVVLSIDNYRWMKKTADAVEHGAGVRPCTLDDWTIQIKIGSTSFKSQNSQLVTATTGEQFYFDKNTASMNLKIAKAIFENQEFQVYLTCIQSAFEAKTSLRVAAPASAQPPPQKVLIQEPNKEVGESPKSKSPAQPPPPPPPPPPSSPLSRVSSSGHGESKRSKSSSSSSSRQYH